MARWERTAIEATALVVSFGSASQVWSPIVSALSECPPISARRWCFCLVSTLTGGPDLNVTCGVTCADGTFIFVIQPKRGYRNTLTSPNQWPDDGPPR